MFLSDWREFPSAPCLAGKTTWWQIASRCRWNRARPWHVSEFVSFLVGLRTYQHPRNLMGCGALRCRMRALPVLASYNAASHNSYQPHPSEPAHYTVRSNTVFVLLKMDIMMPRNMLRQKLIINIWLLHLVILLVFSLSSLFLHIQCRRRKQQVSSKRWCQSTKVHGVTYQKTVIFSHRNFIILSSLPFSPLLIQRG